MAADNIFNRFFGRFFSGISGRTTLLLLAAVLLIGFGHILLLPPFEGYDENAHYSRIEEEAFATPETRSHYLSADATEYAQHGPVSPRWIFARAFNQSYREALKTGRPMRVMENFKTLDYTDYSDFFSSSKKTDEFRKLYREQPGTRVFTSSKGLNWQYQHPPLYYALMGRVLEMAGDAPLAGRLLVLRIVSYLLAFAGLFIGLFSGWRHLELKKHPAANTVAALSAFYPFVMPVFFEEFARIGNDSLCLLLFAITWALVLRHVRQPDDKMTWALIGVAIGVSCFAKMLMVATGFGFLVFMVAHAFRKDAKKKKLRLMPAATAGMIAAGLALPAKTATSAIGSIELSAWLHGQGFVKGDGFPFTNILWNIGTLVTSTIYNFSDLALFHRGDVVMAVFAAALLAVFTAWMMSQPRDPRREEWLPLYVLLPLMGGLLLHAVLGGLAYRPEDVGVTPGRYIHVAAPALMMVLGLGLWRLSQSRKGNIFFALLLVAALLLDACIIALRLALYTGCMSVSEGFSKVAFDTCRMDVMYQKLALLAYPWPGLGLLVAGLLALILTTGLALSRFLTAGQGVAP